MVGGEAYNILSEPRMSNRQVFSAAIQICHELVCLAPSTFNEFKLA